MKSRPILFSAPMVRALLAGTKTQTRRVAKHPHVLSAKRINSYPGHTLFYCTLQETVVGAASVGAVACPYGVPGDQLWVREQFAGSIAYERHGYPLREWGNKIWYCADGEPRSGQWTRPRPSIHMPRSLSRITLELTDVRVERLQDISEADAQAEGIEYSERFGGYCIGEAQHFNSHDPRESYWSLWEAINGVGSVEANPWVWALSFKRV